MAVFNKNIRYGTLISAVILTEPIARTKLDE